jgi:hypothetical protein
MSAALHNIVRLMLFNSKVEKIESLQAPTAKVQKLLLLLIEGLRPQSLRHFA